MHMYRISVILFNNVILINSIKADFLFEPKSPFSNFHGIFALQTLSLELTNKLEFETI